MKGVNELDGINTIEKYQKVLSDFEHAHKDDKKIVRQILEQFEKEKMNVCRAKVILTLSYNMLEIQSCISSEPDKDESDSEV